MLVAPDSMRVPLIEQIDATVEAFRAGQDASIVMKMNSLVDQACIEALYRASQAGVPIALNVRGICCLRPGVPGVSETINVVSVVGRFLEHSRIYSFHRGSESSYYIGSADLMPRNLDTRVELLAPIDNPELRAELDDTLERCLADNTFSWTLQSDGGWERTSVPYAPMPSEHKRPNASFGPAASTNTRAQLAPTRTANVLALAVLDPTLYGISRTRRIAGSWSSHHQRLATP